MNTVAAIVTAIEDRASAVRVITVAPQAAFPFRAGQYAHIKADGHDMRPYSIALAPRAEGHLTFHVRNLGHGLSGHLASLKPGDIISLEGPYGAMDAEEARVRPVLMVAGGTGIAPLLSMAEDIIRRGITEDGITLLYGARKNDDIYCQRELDALMASGELALHMCINPETPDAVLKRLAPDLSFHAVFISGPDPMMRPVHETLIALGARPEMIFTDADLSDLQKAAP